MRTINEAMKEIFALTASRLGGVVGEAFMLCSMRIVILLLAVVMTSATAWAETITLTSDSTAVTLYDGDVLTGTGGLDTYIIIADGATVTLSGVTIATDINHKWVGICCAGNAVIILADGTTNDIMGGYGRPAIFVPTGKTVTIRGTGSLIARGNKSAGIGCGDNSSCGNIVIEGGNITAIGETGAGIGGSKNASCGNITISGGIVNATGSTSAAGIGCGSSESHCGRITITSGVTSVTTTTGGKADAIGLGGDKNKSSVSSLIIDNVNVGRIQQKTFTYNPSVTGTTYTVHFDKNNDAATGTMADQQFTSNRPKTLSPCTFTWDEHHYCYGWNTAADGSGLVFLNEQGIINLGDMTLYAQWKAQSYAITYVDAVDGKDRVVNTNPTSYDYDSPDITLVEPTRTGYEFDGWTWDGHDTPTKTVTIPHNSEGKKTFTAHWSYITQASIHSSLGDITLIDGQTLSGTGGQNTHVTIADGATVTLSGVNITGILGRKWAGITCDGNATIILADGTSNAVKGGRNYYPGIYVPKGKTLTIRGNGSLTATGADKAAGIGGAAKTDCGNIVIEGGKITAIGNKGAAGIGGGKSAACGTITINDGTVNATGGEDAAGIGNGMHGSCGTITINGGNITATVDEDGGTGIGCGFRGTCVGININGGTINATAGNKSAGIGSGASNSYCGDINITAGTVIATGGYKGAGIGSGVRSICRNINIMGGDITATGSQWAAGIGSSPQASCDNINISNCKVTATGGQQGVGIGSGRGSSRKKATCGNISISRTVTSVTATKGEDSPNSIGAAEYGTCGIVNIGGVFGAISNSPYTYVPSGSLNSTVHFEANGGMGSMDDWQFTCTGTWLTIPLCTFTAPDGKIFAGWNSTDNGSGTAFKDEQQILDIPNITLYARWVLPVCTLASTTKEVTLENGQTLTGTGGIDTHVTIADGATVTLNGVNITELSANKWAGITCEGDAIIIIEGDNYVTGGYNSSGIYVPEGKTLTIRGSGSLSATAKSYSAGIGSSDGQACGNINIEGGTITATGIDGAGIGGSQDTSCGNITIGSGVTSITATGNSYNPGIGSGYGAEDVECGNITINGGVIKATGIVGIGSGDKASCGNITINGGTVTATGIGCGKNASCGDITIGSDVNRITATGNSNSAGIGGAESSLCGTITIKGGTIEATGGASGAGIGTGSSGTCEDIIIEGGNITATGGNTGVGVGTGSSGTCGDITIMGGTVTATGGKHASGIGSGRNNSSCGEINITGGTITAQGGEKAAGIGSGYNKSSCGEINILDGVTSVTATKGGQSPYIIGAGRNSTCDEVTVDFTLNDITIGDTRTITKAEWTGNGEVDEPYIIRTSAELLLMAERVNSGKGGYAGKYYELGADIDFVPSVLTVDNDEDDSPESNFPGIGYYIEEPETIRPFTGHFDGKGHTISGIRLDKSALDNVGLFGWIGMGGVVTDVTLADAFITGYNVVGGIAGLNGGTITNCRVKNDVTVQGIGYRASEHGGVAGNVTAMGRVTDCTSAATLDISGATLSRFVGGVTGYSDGLLARNLVLGATVTKASDETYGAIAGYYRYYAGDNKLDKNYYSGCTVAKTKGAAGVGIGEYYDGDDFINNADITDGDGAVNALRDDTGNSTAIGKIAALPESFGTYAVSLAGRTIFKDGAWNTLCLPFEVSTTDSPLAGDDVEAMVLNTSTSKLEGGTLTLNFTAATTIPAGTPFIIRWANTGVNIETPVFTGVTISGDAPTPATSNDGKVSFVGSYSPVALTPNDKSNLFLSTNNTLFWPNAANNQDGNYYVNACRAYFHVDPTATVRAFRLNFGDGNGSAGVSPAFVADGDVHAPSWYTVNGVKLYGKPTKPGLYIHGNKKVVIK